MGFFTLLGIIIIFYYLVHLLILLIADCSIGLAVAEKFGKRLNKFQGKIVWITEASNNFGKAISYEIARNNGKIIISGLKENDLEIIKHKCLKLNPELKPNDVFILPMDIRKMETHRSCFNAVIRHFGSVDILLTNSLEYRKSVWENFDVQEDYDLFEINVFGIISLSRIAVQYFSKKKKGHIVVTTGLGGIMGLPYFSSYAANLHAIHGYFDSLRNEKLGTDMQITLLCIEDPLVRNNNLHEESYRQLIASKSRCIRLVLIAIINNLDEAWIAPKPILRLMYALTHFPNFSKRIAKLLKYNGL